MTASPYSERARVSGWIFTGSAPRRIVPPRSETSFCSGSRSITGCGVSGSNSVEFAPSIPATWRAKPPTAAAEAAGDEHAVGVREAPARALVVLERLGVDPVDLDLRAVLEAGVAQRL